VDNLNTDLMRYKAALWEFLMKEGYSSYGAAIVMQGIQKRAEEINLTTEKRAD